MGFGFGMPNAHDSHSDSDSHSRKIDPVTIGLNRGAVVVVLCPKAAFTEGLSELDDAKRALDDIGIKMVVVRYNNNTPSIPRIEVLKRV